jgi:methionine synthase I (cobalamin-dependent)
VIRANTPRRPPDESEAPERLADEIVALRDEFDLKVIDGCSGTDDGHIATLADRPMVVKR